MEKIKIVEKPYFISYSVLCKLLDDIHSKESIEYSTTGINEYKFQEALNGGTCFVAIDGERLVGLVAACLENSNYWYGKDLIGRIRFLGVDADYQGQHIGSELIRALMEWYNNHNIDTIVLSTSEKNKKAISFYKKLGFKFVDCRPLKSGDHCYVSAVYWFKSSPFSDINLKIKYQKRRIISHIKLKLKY